MRGGTRLGNQPQVRAATPNAEGPDPRWHALRARDPLALGALIEDHIDPLLAFVLHRLDHDRAGAEELVQDTFLEAVRSAPRFRGDSTPFTWLCGIAKKLLLMRRRRAKREARAIPFSDLLLESDEEIARALQRIEHEEIPERLLEKDETRRLVGAVISSLPPEHQAGLLARYRDGKSLEELARGAGTTVKAAEARLYRARRAFAEAFRILAGRALERARGATR